MFFASGDFNYNFFNDDSLNYFMNLAFKEAIKASAAVSPNPFVGSVLVYKNKPVSFGCHYQKGFAHAEVNCINALSPSLKKHLKKMQLFVTLEPCSHVGSTPACCDFIIKSGIKKVYIATIDKNEIVNGSGIKRLKENGVEVIVAKQNPLSQFFNQPFLKTLATKKSYLFLKAALTLDGKIATASGDSKWITSEIARAKVDYLRFKSSAILCGAATLKNDNPTLSLRSMQQNNPTPQWQPNRLFLVNNLDEIDLNLNAIKMASDNRTFFITNLKNQNCDSQKKLNDVGVKFIYFEGNFNFDFLLRELFSRGLNSLLLEGGAKLFSLALESGEVDGGELFFAPKIIGNSDAISAFNFENRNCKKIEDCLNLKNCLFNSYGDNFSLSFRQNIYGAL